VRDRYYQDGIEDGKKAGYEKGVRDMWEVAKDKFSCMCDSWYVKNKCVFETCPIAQKLLKGVK
jgi:flagellar biosynthesis/type III secretory pathway protein FliH